VANKEEYKLNGEIRRRIKRKRKKVDENLKEGRDNLDYGINGGIGGFEVRGKSG
jgi:histidine ammonia-lyase